MRRRIGLFIVLIFVQFFAWGQRRNIDKILTTQKKKLVCETERPTKALDFFAKWREVDDRLVRLINSMDIGDTLNICEVYDDISQRYNCFLNFGRESMYNFEGGYVSVKLDSLDSIRYHARYRYILPDTLNMNVYSRIDTSEDRFLTFQIYFRCYLPLIEKVNTREVQKKVKKKRWSGYLLTRIVDKKVWVASEKSDIFHHCDNEETQKLLNQK